MPSINAGRFTAEIEGDFVVFIIGARPNPLRLIRGLRDLGGNRGMKHMLDYLSENPDKGLLGYEQLGIGQASIEDHTTEAVSRMESVVDEMRTDFDVPMLQVATDQEYQPGLDQIVDFVVSDDRTTST